MWAHPGQPSPGPCPAPSKLSQTDESKRPNQREVANMASHKWLFCPTQPNGRASTHQLSKPLVWLHFYWPTQPSPALAQPCPASPQLLCGHCLSWPCVGGGTQANTMNWWSSTKPATPESKAWQSGLSPPPVTHSCCLFPALGLQPLSKKSIPKRADLGRPAVNPLDSFVATRARLSACLVHAAS